MGGVWKKHKYIKKEGDRYYYKSDFKTVDDITGIKTPDIDAAVDALDNIGPIKKMRDFLSVPIWSPDKEEKTLSTEAKAKINEVVDKYKNKKVTEIGKTYELVDASGNLKIGKEKNGGGHGR